MESGAASAGSLEAIGRDGVFVAYANGVVADAHGQGSAHPLPNTRSTIQHYAPVENQGNPCVAASRR